jgi:hypothetical protein
MGSFARCTQQLEAQGCTVVPTVLSAKLRAMLDRGRNKFPEFVLVRQAFEGLPLRITAELAGEMVLSSARYGVPGGWHRGRDDVVRDGAPASFVPGFDVALTLEAGPCTVEFLPGSGRFGAHDALPVSQLAAMTMQPDDVVIFDSRMVRRWPPESAAHVFWFSVARPWITPLVDFVARIPATTPPRARRFAGDVTLPSRDIGEWLFRTHPKRSG